MKLQKGNYQEDVLMFFLVKIIIWNYKKKITNLDKIHWDCLSCKINAIHILEKNQDKINWSNLSCNINAVPLLEKNVDKIDSSNLSGNHNAIPLLEKNQDKVCFYHLSWNTNIYTYDYEYCRERMDVHREELMKTIFHPCRLTHYLEIGYDFAEMWFLVYFCFVLYFHTSLLILSINILVSFVNLLLFSHPQVWIYIFFERDAKAWWFFVWKMPNVMHHAKIFFFFVGAWRIFSVKGHPKAIPYSWGKIRVLGFYVFGNS